ncbi:WD40-repeat-containing domain protein [Mycena capillaripes]|nr:WD40-repeat-containing domain protein [Mycena capillaripes]
MGSVLSCLRRRKEQEPKPLQAISGTGNSQQSAAQGATLSATPQPAVLAATPGVTQGATPGASQGGTPTAAEGATSRAVPAATQNAGSSQSVTQGAGQELATGIQSASSNTNASGSSTNRSAAARTAAEGLKLALALAEKALDGLPIPGAKGSVGIILRLIEDAEKATSNADTLRQLQAHVKFLSANALEPLKTLPQDDIPSGMTEDVNRLVKALEEVGTTWTERAKRGDLRRRVEAAADEKDLQEFADDVKRVVEQFQTAQEDAVFRDRARLVYELPRAEHAPYNTGRLGGHSTCFQGTRIEVMRTIMSWLEADDDTSTARLFWLNGLAGIGKSTIAKTIAGRADEKGILAGSFFFARGDEKLTNPTLVFPTLAFQLAQVDVALKSSIGQVLQSDTDCAYAGMQIQLQKLITDPLSTTFSSIKRKRLVFILDALDECRDEERTANIVELLLSHLRLMPFVRVLLTSRPESNIQRAFIGPAEHNEYILHNIEETVVQDDIRLYLREKLKAISSKLGLSSASVGQEPKWPRQEDIETLVQMSGTLFVYAATAVRFIGARNPVRQMQILLGVHQASGMNPYAQLDELYIQILREGLPLDKVSDEEVDIFEWVVGTLVLLRDPLALSALSAFIQIALDDVNFTLTYLQSIIIAPSSPEQPPQIYHPSFRDFLTIPGRCSEARYAIQPQKMEKRLTLRCLDFLSNGTLRRNMLGLSQFSLVNEDIVDLELLVQTAFSQEFRYACLYWSSHLQGVESDDSDLVSSLYDFASTYLLFWFEAMSLLNRTSSTIEAMRNAHEWTQNTSHSELKTLMYDGYRFALSHQATMAAGALQVYQSALPFTPHDTLLYQTYAPEEAQSPHLLRGLLADWSPCFATMGGAHGRILAAAYSHDGSLFAVGYKLPFVTIHAASTGAVQFTLENPAPQEVTSLAFLPGDKYIISATNTGIILQWSILTTSIVCSYEGHLSSATCIALSATVPTRMASGSLDTTIRLWDLQTAQCTSVLSCSGSSVHAVAYTPDGTRLLSGSEDGIVRIWDASECHELRRVSAHSSGIGALAISPDGHTYSTGGADCLVKIFSIDSDVPTFTFAEHTAGIIWLAYTDDGETLLSVGNHERHSWLWNTSDGRLKRLCRGYVTQAVFSPDGQRMVTASTDGMFRIWAARDASPINDPDAHRDWVVSVVFSPDGKLLATGGNETDKNVKVWDANTGTLMHTLRGHDWAVYALSFSNDGSMLASGSGDMTVLVWDVRSGGLLSYIGPHESYIIEVQFTEDDLNITSRTPDNTYTWEISLRDEPDLEDDSDKVPMSVLLNKQSEKNSGKPGYMVGNSEGYYAAMGGDGAHMIFMSKQSWEGARMVGAVQMEYRITGFAFHTDRMVIVCTDGSVLIFDVSRLKPWL